MLAATPTPLVLALSIAIPVALLLGVGWLARTPAIRLPRPIEAALSSRAAPAAAGLVMAAITLFVWGSFHEPGVVEDGQAYLLQAEIFAGGRWTGETPPVPEFFEQAHVFVEPHLASKYPPGHSLVLVPGVWLGLPGLMPVVLCAAAGALVFALVRRVSDPVVALLTWALWTTSRTSLFWRASYLSEDTTTVLWLVALWALLRWRSDGKARQLGVVSIALAWMFLTRPLTAVGLAAPIVVLVLATVWTRGWWGHVAWAVALAVPILFLNFLWQQRTLGDWFTSPYAEYSRQYFPSEKPGFGLDRTPPSRQPPPEIAWVAQQMVKVHAAHQPAALPGILAERLGVLLLTLGEQWRVFLVLLFVVGLFRMSGPVAFATVSAGSLILAYLIYAFSSRWVVYYAEVFPVFFLVASHGLAWAGRALLNLDRRRVQAALALTLALMAPCLVWDVVSAREVNDDRSAFHRAAVRTLATIPDASAVVFVHYPQGHNYHFSLIVDSPDYRTARLWLVYDRGKDNERLLRATDRPAYRLFTDTWTLERIR